MTVHECHEMGTYVLSAQWERFHYFHLKIKSLLSKQLGKHFTALFTEQISSTSALRFFCKGRGGYQHLLTGYYDHTLFSFNSQKLGNILLSFHRKKM